MAATIFTVIAIAAFAFASTGLAQSPESDRYLNHCIAKISSRHVIEALVPKHEATQKQDLIDNATQIWYLCVPV
ncbi:hypothetical protein HA466_0182410 [Hirschfeldia incana]|nr:hypothetical protein HA466_0182410 [Hirschfeldia incana]